MFPFSEITKQVQAINDLILSDMACQTEESVEEATIFSRHLLATKNWFSRISWANKKRFVLALLEDVRSAWTLSLLLKSLWNCRPKDAVLSSSEKKAWSSYDEVPVDHNRTAQLPAVLAQVMNNDRLWFLTLDPESQAMVLSELLTVSGGPLLWSVLRRAQLLYERYRNEQLQNIHECIVVNEQASTAKPTATPEKAPQKDSGRKLQTENNDSAASEGPQKQPGVAQKELESKLAAWNQTIKSMKDSLKLEEIEMTFTDGTKKKIWKVNRPKPEAIETVDFLQLLPSSVGKRILSFIPRNQLPELMKVNKYWAYLIEELRAEQIAQQKLQSDFLKLQEVMLRNDTNLELMEQINVPNGAQSSQGNASNALSVKARAPPSVMWASVKSGGAFSMKHFLYDNSSKPIQVPIRNMAELTERLEQRGAADENLWAWCQKVLQQTNTKGDKAENPEGVVVFSDAHFPCPLMKECLEVPLKSPLCKDPALIAPSKPRKNISTANVLAPPKEQAAKRYNLWTRDFSGLYPVFKIPSHQYPN